MVGNLRKKKVDCSRNDQVKKKSKKKDGLEKKRNRKEVEVQFELYYVKLVELVLFEKKNCAPLVFRNYFVSFISFLHS